MMQAGQVYEVGVKPGYKVFGKHVYGNLYGCDSDLLSNPDYLVDVVRNAAREGRMTLLDVKAWHIVPGVSVVGVILESHITIHTWPEHSFATVDVYSCGKHTNPERAFMYIVRALRASRFDYEITDRSYLG